MPEGLFVATTSSIVDFVDEINHYFKCSSHNGKCRGEILSGIHCPDWFFHCYCHSECYYEAKTVAFFNSSFFVFYFSIWSSDRQTALCSESVLYRVPWLLWVDARKNINQRLRACLLHFILFICKKIIMKWSILLGFTANPAYIIIKLLCSGVIHSALLNKHTGECTRRISGLGLPWWDQNSFLGQYE